MRARIPAGLADSGLTALGTFIITLYAVDRIADPADFGVYALFMAAYLFVAAVTTQLVFIPAEKVTLEVAAADRTGIMGATLVRGLGPAILMSALVSIAALVTALQGATSELIIPLWITATAAGVVTPLHDHLRRVLHLAEYSWWAANVSLVQFVAAVAWLLVLGAVAVSPVWVPFTAIAASRLTSLLVGLYAAVRTARSGGVGSRAIGGMLTYRELFRTGRYLAATGALSTGNNLIVATMVSWFVGLDALGYAEAARTVAQPILVLANGLRSVVAPRSMEAARSGDRPAARSAARTFHLITIALGGLFVIVAGFDWALNPLRGVAAKAYVVGGLVIVTIVANALNGAAFPTRFELIGGDKERSLLGAEVWANAAQLAIAVVMAAVAGTSVTVGAMARPVAFAGLGLTRLGLYRRPLEDHYRTRTPA